MILAAWALFVLAQTPVETAQKKMRATEAYRQRKFESACQLFNEVVTEQRYDAWGWNDLAVCRIHVNDLSGALDAMEKSSALEKAVGGDQPLVSAINANEALLVSSVTRRKPVDAALAARLASRRKLTDEKSACELYELATQGVATLQPEDWNFIAYCRTEKQNAPAERIVEALRHLDQIFDPGLALAMRERTARAANASSDWKTSCAPLPNTCGAKLLACSKQSDSNENYLQTTSESLVFIEAATLKRWKKSPLESATEKQLLSSEFTSSPVRCPDPDSGMSALDSVESGHVLLTVDACARTATFLVFDRQCSHGTGQLVVEPIVIMSP